MIIIFGLVILAAAVIAGVAGVLGNGGSGHALTHPFAVFGYHVTGSTGTLFLYGIATGAVALFGLSLLLAGARRTSRRGRQARHGLRQARRETAAVSQERDDLLEQREVGSAAAGMPPNGSPSEPQSAPDGSGWWRRLGHRSGRRQPAVQPAGTLTAQSGRDVPAGDSSGDAPAPAP
jgi:hypothetical protein